jgi:hypothetical protein
VDDAIIQRLVDRQQVDDTIYRYASTIDARDYAGLRRIFVDEAVAQYGGAPEIRGADAIVKWIEEMCVDQAFQHHLINVYHVDLDGDEARALVYHTSHQTLVNNPDTVHLIVGRYRDVLRRVDGTWKIAEKRMEIGWMEDRHFSQAAASRQEADQNLGAQSRALDVDRAVGSSQ